MCAAPAGGGCSQIAAQGAQGDCRTATPACAEFIAHFPHGFGLGQLILCWTKPGLAQAWDYSLQAVWMRPVFWWTEGIYMEVSCTVPVGQIRVAGMFLYFYRCGVMDS